MLTVAEMITQEKLKEALHYSHETGMFIWKSSKFGPKEGAVAGGNNHGYVRIKIDGVDYLAHRLAWLYVYGKFPPRIDHADTNRANNSIGNLRIATQSQNIANSVRKRGGLKGASKFRNKWLAAITVNYKKIYLGLFLTPLEAHLAYCSAAKRIFGEFARPC